MSEQAFGVTLAAEGGSVPLARRTVHAVLTGWGVPANAAVLDAAQLIATELVLNAVRHTTASGPGIDLLIALNGHHFDITVHDRDPRLPVVPAAGAALRNGGLAVIAALADGFGGHLSVTPDSTGPGKGVTVLLPRPGR
ncbi:ATP-binding protein [Kitasatospora sp. NPDC002227]|uniref:ATP-binding protein n=1 Tax=Kitasatospora sp. NPDC002227 TaxID=3154773 RepID=UPI0033330024